MIILFSLLIGIVAGLRGMMAPAAISWMAAKGGLNLSGSWLAFLGYRFTPWVFTLLALLELVADQLPATPSRKEPPGFVTRLVTGGACGAALALPAGLWAGGLVAGLAGAVIGTLGGARFRAWLAKAFANDRPAAIIEDVIAIAGAYLIVRLAM